MNFFKISSIGFLVFCFLLGAQIGEAATVTATPKTPPPASTSKVAKVVATVNIRDAKIISQDKNKIKISFNLTNKEKSQAGIKYSVKLLKTMSNGIVVVDQYIYPEVLSLDVNSSIKKDIEYIAPSGLSGNYKILVEAKNTSGLTLGVSTIGNIDLVSTSDMVVILPESCKLSTEKTKKTFNVIQGIIISPEDQIKMDCTVVNSSKKVITASPVYETHLISMFGSIAETSGGDTTPITFKAGEKKNISLKLPKTTLPQIYEIKISFKSDDLISNPVITKYVLSGASAVIQNFSINKDSYKKGEVANFALLSSASQIKNITLLATINDKNKECVTPISQTVASGLVDISAQIITDCSDPVATVTLKDANGKVLDEKVLTFKSTNAQSKISLSKNSKIVIISFGLLVVLGIAIYFINLKRKQNESIVK